MVADPQGSNKVKLNFMFPVTLNVLVPDPSSRLATNMSYLIPALLDNTV